MLLQDNIKIAVYKSKEKEHGIKIKVSIINYHYYKTLELNSDNLKLRKIKVCYDLLLKQGILSVPGIAGYK